MSRPEITSRRPGASTNEPDGEPRGGRRRGPHRFHGLYGAAPRHLLLVVLALVLTAYTLSVLGLNELWDPETWWQSILIWFLGAIIAHDLLLFPLYAAADRVLYRVTRDTRRRQASPRPAVSALNYVRVPLMGVILLFVLFFPGILQQGSDAYLNATGQTQVPFLRRWLLLSAVILATAAAAYAARTIAHRRAAAATPPEQDHDPGPDSAAESTSEPTSAPASKPAPPRASEPGSPTSSAEPG